MNGQSQRLEFVFRVGVALLLVCWCGLVQAQVPHVLNYQGYLTNPGGTPINVPVVMTFRLYGAPSGGSAIYTEIQPSVSVTNGIFNAVIGSATPLTALQFDVPYWLTVTINADGEMSPRQEVTASAYAIRSANADALAPAATVAGAQVTGSIVTGTLPTGNLTGTIGTAQIANNAVTQAKLSPVSGAAAGKVLATDGTNLLWQSASAGSPAPATTVVSETAFGQAAAVGASVNYAREDHTHGTPTQPTLPVLAGDVSGAIGSNQVTGLQTRAVAATAPANGQVLTWNAGFARWEPATPPIVPPAPVIASWVGQGSTLTHGASNYIFVGPTVAMVVPSGGRITASASVPMATFAGTTAVRIGICYQLGAGPLILFAGGFNYQESIVTTTVTMVSTHASLGFLSANTYTVGLCGLNAGGANDIGVVDWVNGWAMVTSS